MLYKIVHALIIAISDLGSNRIQMLFLNERWKNEIKHVYLTTFLNFVMTCYYKRTL